MAAGLHRGRDETGARPRAAVPGHVVGPCGRAARHVVLARVAVELARPAEAEVADGAAVGHVERPPRPECAPAGPPGKGAASQTKRALPTRQNTAATRPAAGIVSTHATAMLPATPQRTADSLRVAPTP